MEPTDKNLHQEKPLQEKPFQEKDYAETPFEAGPAWGGHDLLPF